MIDQIAFEANILALNAAVQAAKGSDGDMGSAVIDCEVRNLTHRSVQGARDTAALIGHSGGIGQFAFAAGKMEQVCPSDNPNAEESVGASEDLAGHAQSLYAVGERVRKLVRGAADVTRLEQNENGF